MSASLSENTTRTSTIRVHEGLASAQLAKRLGNCLGEQERCLHLSMHPASLHALSQGLNHRAIFLEAFSGQESQGFLALAHVRSMLFGRFLVSLPYLNYGGVVAKDDWTKRRLIDRAIQIADTLRVRHLELRHVTPVAHSALTGATGDKVHMRRELPSSADELWQQISGKVRNQIRKARKQNFSVNWGNEDRLAEFHDVFSRNMRDLGTPVFGKGLFGAFLQTFPERAELCVVRDGKLPIAAALLLHGLGVTEVPSASSLRSYNPRCANMLLYWNLLQRAIERGQQLFDFGRSSPDSPTFRFKKQWGAQPIAANWQYYVRQGNPHDARRDNPRYERFIRIWKRLPLSVTRLIGPSIVRGIP